MYYLWAKTATTTDTTDTATADATGTTSFANTYNNIGFQLGMLASAWNLFTGHRFTHSFVFVFIR